MARLASPFLLVSNTAIVIDIGIVPFQVYRPGVMAYSFAMVSFVEACQTCIKLRVGALMDALVFDKSMKIVVNGFSRYAVGLEQVG